MGTASADTPPSGPQRLQQLHFSSAIERVLAVSLQFDVYSHIAAGKKTAAEIAQAAGASERGMRVLLDAAVGLELLRKEQGHYELTAEAARYLVRDRPDYVGEFFASDTLRNLWAGLADAVRSGQPVHSVSPQDAAEEFFPQLVGALDVINRPLAQRLATHLLSSDQPVPRRVLDVGCGSAVWSLTLAQADPQIRLTLPDWPRVLERTRTYVARAGLSDRVQFFPGDLLTVPLGERTFDLALLGNVAHGLSEPELQRLFARLQAALDSGGRLAIIDMIPNDERTGPLFPLLFALLMLVQTDAGGTYTLAEYRAWLEATGFVGIETVDIGSHSPVILARKP